MLPKKRGPFSRVLSLLLAAALMLTTAITFSVSSAASSAADLAEQIKNWGNNIKNGPIYVQAEGNVVTVSGDVGPSSPATETLSLSLDNNVVVLWSASVRYNTGSYYSPAISVTGNASAEFVLQSGWIRTESGQANCLSISGPKFTMTGGTLENNATGSASGSPLSLSSCPLAVIDGGSIIHNGTAGTMPAMSVSSSIVHIKRGTISSAGSNGAIYATNKSAVFYESAASITGTKVANSASSAVIAQVTAANPMPAANLDKSSGLSIQANGSPAATVKWIETDNKLADVEVTFSSGTVVAPLQRKIQGYATSITISKHPVSGATLDAGTTDHSLTVAASASPSKELSYQWYYNAGSTSNRVGVKVPGATEPTLVTPTSSAGTGGYFCEVSALGSPPVRSAAARVTVRPSVTANIYYAPNPLRKGLSGTITVSYTLAGSSFVNPISAAEFGVSGLPEGMTAGAPVRYNSERVTVTITGTPTNLISQITADDSLPKSQFTSGDTNVSITVKDNVLNLKMAKNYGEWTSESPSEKSKTTNSITVNAIPNASNGQTTEFAISTQAGLAGDELNALAWQDGTTFNGLSPETSYTVYARAKENNDYEAGYPRSSQIITLSNRSIAVTAEGLSDLTINKSVAGSGKVLFTLSGGTYASTITPSAFAVTGLPAGMYAGTAVRTSDTVVTVPIMGAPSTYNAATVSLNHSSSIAKANITGALTETTVTGTVTAGPVNKIDVSANITFSPGSKTYTGSVLSCASAKLNGVTAGSGATWTYTYSAASGGASLGTGDRPLTAGTYNVTAAYSDSRNAGSVTEVFTVEKANQAALSITNPGAKVYGGAPFQLTATGGTGSGAVTYSLVSGNATVTPEGMVTLTGIGDISVKATKASDNNYNETTSSNCVFQVEKGSPAVVWPTGLTATYGQTLSDISLAGFANTPAGTFKWNSPTDSVGTAGSQAHNMTFTPQDSTNYVTRATEVIIMVNPQPITSAAITVTSPATAAAPDTTASGTGNFTVGAVTWSPADSTFKGNTQYTATVTLTANANYTFAGIADALINGNAATIVSNTGTALTLSYQFNTTSAAVMTGMQLVTQPAKLSYSYGETLDLSGLSVKLLYNDGTDEVIAAEDFAASNIAAAPSHGAALIKADNGTVVTVTCGEFTVKTDALTVTTADHPHIWPADWSWDADDHWKVCECGERSGQAEHTPGEWIIDTDAIPGTDGSKHKECTVCGYVIATEKIPALPNIPLTGKIERKNVWWRHLLHIITFGIFWDEFQEVTITPDAAGVTVKYFIADKDTTKEQITESDWKTYSKPFRFHPPLFCKKVVFAQLTDAYGNSKIISK